MYKEYFITDDKLDYCWEG